MYRASAASAYFKQEQETYQRKRKLADKDTKKHNSLQHVVRESGLVVVMDILQYRKRNVRFREFSHYKRERAVDGKQTSRMSNAKCATSLEIPTSNRHLYNPGLNREL